MKRIFLVVLMLCIFLTSCTSGSEPDIRATTSPTVDSLTNPVLPAPPENGSHVKTDFSAYEKANHGALYARLSDEPLEDLRPTRNGKQIYPFLGEILRHEYHVDYRYGIVDKDGCILADPVYSNVYPLLDEDTGTVLPYWVLEKTKGEPNAGMAFFTYGKKFYGLASMDGSFVTDCIYSQIYSNDGQIMAFQHLENYDHPKSFEVFNLKGKRLFTSDSLSFGDKLYGHPDYYKCGQGLYTVIFENLTEYPLKQNDSRYGDMEYYLMNKRGKLIAGPFYDVKSLTGGPISVMNQNGDYVYIDPKGNVISDAYSDATSFRNGSANVVPAAEEESFYYWEGNCEILDQDMKTLASGENAFHRTADGCYYTSGAVCEEDSDGQACDAYDLTVCYSPQGEVLWTREGLYDVLTSSFAIKTEDDPEGYGRINLYLEHIPGGKTYKLSPNSIVRVKGDPNDPFFQVEDSEKVVLNGDLNVVASWDNGNPMVPLWEKDKVSYDVLTIREGGMTTVYTGCNRIYARYPKVGYSICKLYPGGIGAFTDEKYTEFYTPEGERIFAYPINHMDD